jgi:hypothetical protein
VKSNRCATNSSCPRRRTWILPQNVAALLLSTCVVYLKPEHTLGISPKRSSFRDCKIGFKFQYLTSEDLPHLLVPTQMAHTRDGHAQKKSTKSILPRYADLPGRESPTEKNMFCLHDHMPQKTRFLLMRRIQSCISNCRLPFSQELGEALLVRGTYTT